MSKLMSLISILVTVVLISCTAVTAEKDKKWDHMHIANKSCCLLAAVTIVEFVPTEDGTSLKSMDLVWGDWLEPGEIREVPLVIGKHYGGLVEAFERDIDTKKATAKVGEMFREGKFEGGDSETAKIDIHCGHTEPTEI